MTSLTENYEILKSRRVPHTRWGICALQISRQTAMIRGEAMKIETSIDELVSCATIGLIFRK